ncbi:DUF5694 domain-containing protein [Pseudoxanthomonas indica]|uniref:TraB family protein n=1 Tax=Pseudoxanthomonas indica TaxID=428993 RepID=A0A1T5K9Z8_9GAMM|nr:DUF5694 domain-containing protein [Pseudoxanthomonas indica]GGD47844.1 hypothetical protein GCM10007235_19660 [Pseudoxanthomonas indica]SKC60496.1 hypothetical protein SAMN06296058_1507 [Pseudoxanthomonas indica]
MNRCLGIVAACLLAIPAAHAQTKFDLTTLDKDMSGPRTQVLVLGSVHLSQLPKEFDPRSLDPMLDRLAAFRPEIITIEAISGEQCDLAARHPTIYGADYCPDTTKARAATGLDVPAAIAGVQKALAAWPARPTPAQRRALAALFLAANDRASAYTQWLQLPEAERHAGDGLDETLVAMLGEIAARNNENYQIAARLAARLGLPRVHAVDDHTGDNIQVPEAETEAFGQSVMAAWKSGRSELNQSEQQEKSLSAAPDLLPLYRFINQPEQLWIRADVNAGATMRAKSDRHYPQIWVNGWEIRNLRMVANIHQTFRERPGARVLSVVGVSHKPWFDQWLGQMQGVDIVDVGKMLE